MMFDPTTIARKSVLELKPYSSARDEFDGEARIKLDANENAFGSPVSEDYSRYPDPYQYELKDTLAELNGVRAEQIFLGNGSDEAIDLLIRVFCDPKHDEIIVCPPTYGMYEVSASVNETPVWTIQLTEDFQPDVEAIAKHANKSTKLLFLCSPNNPTSNLLDKSAAIRILEDFPGIVVIDEAYIEFSSDEGFARRVSDYGNLVVLKTLSKAWGLAGLRIGMAFADPRTISLLNRIKPPYNISAASQNIAARALKNKSVVSNHVALIREERRRVSEALARLSITKKVFPSEANFLLVRFSEPHSVYKTLESKGIVVRDRSRLPLCEGCLRITVGTTDENDQLINTLREFEYEEVAAG